MGRDEVDMWGASQAAQVRSEAMLQLLKRRDLARSKLVRLLAVVETNFSSGEAEATTGLQKKKCLTLT